MREPSDSGDHPETSDASMITMIASMYPTVARKLARNFRYRCSASAGGSSHARCTGETFDRKATRASGGALIIALSLVMLLAEERDRT